jgi:hypothetical protein
VLPGFLVLVAFGIVWRGTVTGRQKALPWEFPKAEFWVIAVTISGLMAIAYPLVGRSYLETYGVEDIAIVWLISIVIGSIAAASIARILRAVHEKRIRLQVPASTDGPTAALDKLSRVGLGIRRDVVKFDGKEAFALEDRDSRTGSYWVAPPIVVTWEDNADSRLVEALEDAIAKNDAKAAANALRAASDNNAATVAWRKIDNLVRPTSVEASKLGWHPTASMVQQE